MPRPLAGTEPLDQRLHLMVSRSDVEAVDDWMFKNRVRSRSEAIRQLLQLGLDAAEAREAKPDRPEPGGE